MPELEVTALTADREVARLSPLRWRRLGWAGLPILLLSFWFSAGQATSEMAHALIPRVAYGLPVAATVGLCVLAGRSSAVLERRFWHLLAIANGALLAAEVLLGYWLVAIDPVGPTRISWPFQALHVVAAVSFIGVLATMSRLATASMAARVRYVADVSVVALVVYVIAIEAYARPVMTPAGAAPGDVLVGAAYPVVAFLLLLGTVGNVAGFKIVKWRQWEKLVVAALAVYVVGVALWPAWYATAVEGSRNETRGVLDLVQLTGHYVLMMAGVYRLTERAPWCLRPLPPFTIGRRRWLSAAIPLAALGALALVAAAAFVGRNSAPWDAIYGGMVVALTGLVLARSAVLSLEHGTLFHRSLIDPLTGVYGLRYFHDRLAEELSVGRAEGDEVAVIIVDIDDFARFNAAVGYSDGDRSLAEMASRLCDVVGTENVIARLGGNRFGVIIHGSTASEAAVVAQRLVDRVGIECAAQVVPLTVSAGVAASPDHGIETAELLRLAECSLLWAKQSGKNRVVVFDRGRVPELSAQERIENLERQSRIVSVRAFAAAVDARDPDARFHSRNVAALAVRLASALGMAEDRARMVATAAIVHDVGKIGVPEAVLFKTGALSETDWRRIREHPVLGQRMLATVDLAHVLSWVRSHHERWDGGGYPDGLSGDDIPVEARIIAVCDAYDAMTSGRPYRRAMSVEAALQEIDLNMGTQFDPEIADMFIRLVSSTESPGGNLLDESPGQNGID